MDIIAPFIFVILVAILGGAYSMQGANIWYNTLPQPPGNPPRWVFSVVWPILYTMIAISWCRCNYIAAGMGPEDPSIISYTLVNVLFLVNLLLNLAWSIVFFYAKLIKFAFFIIIAMIVTLAVLMWYVRKDLACLLLLVPYLLWLIYAAYLNGYIMVATWSS